MNAYHTEQVGERLVKIIFNYFYNIIQLMVKQYYYKRLFLHQRAPPI